MDQAITLIREFGFPVFVSLWFMIRLERRVDRLSELLTSLMQATAILAKSIENSRAPTDRGSHLIATDEKPS